MLDEGWRRKERGTDVVVGFVETHRRPKTQAQLRDLEVVPRRTRRLPRDGASRRWTSTPSWPAARRSRSSTSWPTPTCPAVAHEKRWQDVEELLDAGIDVITTVNIQHLESLNDVVERITGIHQRETVPDDVVRRADQIELVDMSPEALRRRMAHGNIYPPERVDAALANYFRPGNLAALRELALLWVADRVEESLHGYMEAHGIAEAWETRERVVVAVTGAPGGEQLVRRAARIAGPPPRRADRCARRRRRTACRPAPARPSREQRRLLERARRQLPRDRGRPGRRRRWSTSPARRRRRRW